MPNQPNSNIEIDNPVFAPLESYLTSHGASANDVATFIANVVNLINTGNSSSNPSLLVEQINALVNQGWSIAYPTAASAVSNAQTDFTHKQIDIVINPFNSSALQSSQTALQFVGSLAYEVGHAEDPQANTEQYTGNALAVGAEVTLEMIGEAKSLYNQIQFYNQIQTYNQIQGQSSVPNIILSGSDEAQAAETNNFANSQQALLLGASDLATASTVVTALNPASVNVVSYYWNYILSHSGLTTSNTDSSVLTALKSMNMSVGGVLNLAGTNGLNFTQNSTNGTITMVMNFANSGSGNNAINFNGNNTTISSYVNTFSGYGTITSDSTNGGQNNIQTVNPSTGSSTTDQIFDFASGGSLVDEYYNNSSGSYEAVIAYTGQNGTGTKTYQQINTITSTSGQIRTVDISGAGDVASVNAVNITSDDNTTATVTGDNDTITTGNNDNITLIGANNVITVGADDTIDAGSNTYLTTDSLNFEGRSITGNITRSGDTDSYGRTYTLNGSNLSITGGSDSLTISNFQNGDFGLDVGYVVTPVQAPDDGNIVGSVFLRSATGINNSDELVGETNRGGFIDTDGTYTSVAGLFITGINDNGLMVGFGDGSGDFGVHAIANDNRKIISHNCA